MNAIKNKKTCLVAVSGGMDSYILVKYFENAGFEVKPVYFYHGSRQEYREIELIMNIHKNVVHYARVSLPFNKKGYTILDSNTGKNDYIPGRNTLFIANLMSMAESMLNVTPENQNTISISLGVTASGHESFPDTRPAFIEHSSKMVMAATEGKVSLLAPFLTMTRATVIAMGVGGYGITPKELAKTYSCYKGNPVHCGACHACKSRQKGFKEAGVPDLTTYKETI
jgi:7-cyano-7-deazaguanine synthase